MTTTSISACPICDETAVRETQIEETVQIKHDHKLYDVTATVPAFVCAQCGAKSYDERADEAFRTALRDQLGLLHPSEIVELRDRFGLSQADVEKATGIAATTLSKWEQFHVIQSRASDDHLRRYFDDMKRRFTVASPTLQPSTAYSWSSSVSPWMDAPETQSACVPCAKPEEYSLAA